MNKILPKRVICYANADDAENILNNNIDRAVFNCNGCITLKENGYILIDFGKEINGGVLITTQKTSSAEAKYRIVFGESVMEALSSLGEKNSGNYHSIRDMTVPAVFMSSQRFGQTGFRFVKIEAVGGEIVLRSVKAVSDTKKFKYKGSFECSDPLLNEVWKTGAYTLQLNMNEFLWDGIKRDRLVWIGDMHPETRVIRAVFGNDECIRRSLESVKEETPPSGWMNSAPTYSMWWIIIQYDLYMYSGDIEYLKKQIDYIKAVADKVTGWIDGGYVSESSLGRFVDWSSCGQECELDGIKAIICMALDRSEKIMRLFSENEAADKCRVYLSKLRDENDSGAEPNNRIASLTVLSGRRSERARQKLLSTTPDDMSCFMGYYILLALAKKGKHKKCLQLIRDYWGAMLKLGATTFWEEFKPEWAKNAARIDEVTPKGKINIHGEYGEHCYSRYRLSLCHGWAAGPTAFLSEQIGGIEILSAGCKKMQINPNPAGLAWFKIKYPTPYGTVKINYDKNRFRKTFIEAPDDIEIINLK